MLELFTSLPDEGHGGVAPFSHADGALLRQLDHAFKDVFYKLPDALFMGVVDGIRFGHRLCRITSQNEKNGNRVSVAFYALVLPVIRVKWTARRTNHTSVLAAFS